MRENEPMGKTNTLLIRGIFSVNCLKIFEILVIILCTFIFPWQLSIYQHKYAILQNRQQIVNDFASSVSLSISYFYARTEFACKAAIVSSKESDKMTNSYLLKSDEYFDKFLTVNPPYDSICYQVGIYFPTVRPELDHYIEKLETYFNSPIFHYISIKSCLENQIERKQRYEDMKKEYSNIMKKLILEMNR